MYNLKVYVNVFVLYMRYMQDKRYGIQKKLFQYHKYMFITKNKKQNKTKNKNKNKTHTHTHTHTHSHKTQVLRRWRKANICHKDPSQITHTKKENMLVSDKKYHECIDKTNKHETKTCQKNIKINHNKKT